MLRDVRCDFGRAQLDDGRRFNAQGLELHGAGLQREVDQDRGADRQLHRLALRCEPDFARRQVIRGGRKARQDVRSVTARGRGTQGARFGVTRLHVDIGDWGAILIFGVAPNRAGRCLRAE